MNEADFLRLFVRAGQLADQMVPNGLRYSKAEYARAYHQVSRALILEGVIPEDWSVGCWWGWNLFEETCAREVVDVNLPELLNLAKTGSVLERSLRVADALDEAGGPELEVLGNLLKGAYAEGQSNDSRNLDPLLVPLKAAQWLLLLEGVVRTAEGRPV